ncbi:tetratricopeptide repeat protein [Sphingomonas gilva]|uniref:Tetratricopeptide repeat protein n=1 Tax=Sphingomonas gilva TaxID=2305907 RepID=A0A396RVW7_9SPHN|nr:tetratricopeptide repeat protein [Sphingomonas gilva]RHW17821.1 tetratricopeptide repeat protein [Sphingomonas gilva]
MRIGFAVAALAMVSAPAFAQEYGYQQIADGKLLLAESELDAARVAEPGEPSVMINLAAIYARTGRTDQAKAMYREVLATDNVLLELGDHRPAWSHDLARLGLRKSEMAAR